MADYAPNFTARIRVKYSAFGRIHTQTWRTPAAGALDAGIGAAVVDIGNYYADIEANLSDDFAILGTSFAREGEDLFFPSIVGVTVTPGGGTPPAGAIKRFGATHYSLVGRTSGGLRAVIYQYGWVTSGPAVDGDPQMDDFRLYATESPDVATLITDMNGVLVTLCGNDGQGITWYPYLNFKQNDYWLKKSRAGS